MIYVCLCEHVPLPVDILLLLNELKESRPFLDAVCTGWWTGRMGGEMTRTRGSYASECKAEQWKETCAHCNKGVVNPRYLIAGQ